MTEPEKVASPGELARRLMRATDRATLATLLARDFAQSWPYASLVLTACAPDAAPLLLLSDLADHSRNIAADGRVSLLFDGTVGLDEPLTGPRLTLVGRARETADESYRARYLARHPSAAGFASFKDFRLYRVEATHGHLVAGFGRIHWLEAREIFDDGSSAALAARELDIVAHMNADHADAVNLYARRLLRLPGDGWTMTGIDPDGIDLRAGGTIARLTFVEPVRDADAARAALARLAHEARKMDESTGNG